MENKRFIIEIRERLFIKHKDILPNTHSGTEVFLMQSLSPCLCAFVFRKIVRYSLRTNLFSLFVHFSDHSATKTMQFPQINEEPNKRLAIAGKRGKEEAV
jgi:hypothetical protein